MRHSLIKSFFLELSWKPKFFTLRLLDPEKFKFLFYFSKVVYIYLYIYLSIYLYIQKFNIGGPIIQVLLDGSRKKLAEIRYRVKTLCIPIFVEFRARELFLLGSSILKNEPTFWYISVLASSFFESFSMVLYVWLYVLGVSPVALPGH